MLWFSQAAARGSKCTMPVLGSESLSRAAPFGYFADPADPADPACGRAPPGAWPIGLRSMDVRAGRALELAVAAVAGAVARHGPRESPQGARQGASQGRLEYRMGDPPGPAAGLLAVSPRLTIRLPHYPTAAMGA